MPTQTNRVAPVSPSGLNQPTQLAERPSSASGQKLTSYRVQVQIEERQRATAEARPHLEAAASCMEEAWLALDHNALEDAVDWLRDVETETARAREVLRHA